MSQTAFTFSRFWPRLRSRISGVEWFRFSNGMTTFGKVAAVPIFLVLFVFVVLAGADAAMFIPTGGSQCELKFPKWLGCVIANHENLSGGLIGSAGTLFAGWLAWTAVQLQMNSERERKAQTQMEAKEAAVLAITPPVHAAASALGFIQVKISMSREDAAVSRSIVNSIGYIEDALGHFTVRDAVRDLNANDRVL